MAAERGLLCSDQISESYLPDKESPLRKHLFYEAFIMLNLRGCPCTLYHVLSPELHCENHKKIYLVQNLIQSEACLLFLAVNSSVMVTWCDFSTILIPISHKTDGCDDD